MAAYKDKERGTWYAMIRYTDPDGKPKSKIKRGFELKRDAVAYESEFRKSLITSETNLTFRQVMTLYLKNRHSNNETKKRTQTFMNTHLKANMDTKMRLFTPSRIIGICDEIKASDYSKSSKNQALTYFKSILRFSNSNFDTNLKIELISKMPRQSNDIIEYVVWNDEEFNQFIQHVSNYVYQVFFILLYRTGLRRGEALALTYDDLQGNYLDINKAYRRKLSTLKNVSSYRRIMIDKETIDLLTSLMLEDGHLFFYNNHYLSLSTLQRAFDDAVAKSGVRDSTIHNLRHAHATNLINKGANIAAVSQRLGHANINMTIKTYTNITKSTEESLIDIIRDNNFDNNFLK